MAVKVVVTIDRYECSACNKPVRQRCCYLEMPPLKAGIMPYGCPLNRSPEWKKLKSKNKTSKAF